MQAKTATLGPSVAVLAYDGLSPFEFGVACAVFGQARPELGVPWYRFSICAAAPGPVRTETGFAIEVEHGLGRLARAGIVVVPPTDQYESVRPEVLDALRGAHRRGTRLVSLCTGAFVLGEAGLLEGRRVTTHWAESDELAARYPAVAVDPKVLYVEDGNVLTSAGSAASIDLCLSVVRSDYGAEVATHVARDLVVPPHRDGGQAQYIEAPIPDRSDTDLFAGTFAWLEEHLAEPITIEDLASRAAMSPRTFARRFRASTGATPYQWLLRHRLALAQRLLETGDAPIEFVARASGFGTATNLRKHFQRALCTGPQAYRRTFHQERAG